MTPIGYLETGVLICGDNLERLAEFPDECIDLIYLDPPFFSNRYYEVIWGDEAEVRSFEDRWKGGIQHYIGWMRDRVAHLHRVLKSSGSLYLHCDPAASHYLKVMLDGIFGIDQFRNEIIWRRTGSHNSTRRFGPIHDVLLFYSKSDEYFFQRVYRPYLKGHVEQYFKQRDDRGHYWMNALTGAGKRKKASGKPWRGYDPTKVGRHWAIPRRIVAELGIPTSLSPQEKLDAFDEAGFIAHPPSGSDAMPTYRQYLDDSPGMPIQDIWAYQPHTRGVLVNSDEGIDEDVRWLRAQGDPERLGYPTQKPEALLERVVKASSRKGDVVLDAFCGCGTTVVVAERLGRKWVGIDISPTAVNLIVRRMARLGVESKTYGLPRTEADLRTLKPFEFQNWVVQQVHGTHAPRQTGDMGIDGYSFFERLPMQIKQSDHVGRNVVDNFETAIRRTGNHKGYIFAFSFTRGAYEETARIKSEGMEIELVAIRDLLAPSPPPAVPVEPGLDMLADLHEAVRRAQQEAAGSRPERSVTELIASDTNGVDHA